MNTKAEPDVKVWVVTQMTENKRYWSLKAVWTGWRRILGFGLVFNVVDIAATMWIFGWQLQAGRLPKETSHTIPIMNLSRAAIPAPEPEQPR